MIKEENKFVNANKENLTIINTKHKRACGKLFYVIGFIIGLSLFSISTFCIFHLWFTDSYERYVLNNMRIIDGTEIYKIWRKPEAFSLVYVYPFNYTDGLSGIFNNSTNKISVQEAGPYVFREETEKINIVFEGEEAVTFSVNRSHTFVPEMSKGSLDDFIIAPNVPVIAALAKSKSASVLDQMIIQLLLSGLKSDPFVPMKVKDFIMGSKGDSFAFLTRKLSQTFKNEVPPQFGILVGRTGFIDEKITIGTGVNDLDSIGIIKKFDGREKLDAWTTECNNLTGSDGNVFPGRVVATSERLYIYAKGLCRRIPLIFEKDLIAPNGFPARRYVLADDVWSSGSVNPENACFCQEDCPPSGTFSIKPCTFDAPVVLSYPHFLYGDEILFENIEGLSPDQEKHRFYFDIHSTLGLPIGGNSRFQIGIVVEKAPFRHELNEIKEGTVLPIAWVDIEIGEIQGGAVFDKIYEATFKAASIKLAAQIIFIIGSLLSLAGMCAFCLWGKIF